MVKCGIEYISEYKVFTLLNMSKNEICTTCAYVRIIYVFVKVRITQKWLITENCSKNMNKMINKICATATT